jgi:hypothetical protein
MWYSSSAKRASFSALRTVLKTALQRCFHDARRVSEEALAIRRVLAAEAPEAHLADLATTLSNLAMLLDDLRDFSGAIEALKTDRVDTMSTGTPPSRGRDMPAEASYAVC